MGVVSWSSSAVERQAAHLQGAGSNPAFKSMKNKWLDVVAGILDGTLLIGTRTPVEGVPAWATLDVAHGGFATGELVAGGALRPHEVALGERLGVTTRGALNRHFLGEAGHGELLAMLRAGTFRIEVPEEGALLATAWMVENDANDEAIAILSAIAPFFERLRFYPVPHERALVGGMTVHRETVGDVTDRLRGIPDDARVLAMNETLTVWTPLYDRTVALVLETVVGGEVGRTSPPGWAARAEALLLAYAEARATHTLSGMPERPKGGFYVLRAYLRLLIDDRAPLTDGQRAYVRRILDAIVAKRGPPGSTKLAAVRAAQASDAARPLHGSIRSGVVAQLASYPQDEGLPSLDGIVTASIPAGVARKVERALDAPIDELVERGVIASGEVLGLVVPQMTSQIRAAGIEAPELRRLYAGIHAAFRKRRSLLLVNLATQVRIEELPWVAAMARFRRDDERTEDTARACLVEVTLLALTSFPETIVPNKLLAELRALATSAGIDVPLVEELAADIFMGTFTEKFLRAAQDAAWLLRGSLYERYYGIPFEDVLAIRDIVRDKHAPRDARVSEGFAALCAARAKNDPDGMWSVARNGKIIEQEQLLTTHNLASLVAALDLGPPLREASEVLAQRCFSWICAAQSQDGARPRTRLRRVKKTAYAWRQMLFFLSVGEVSPVRFVSWASEELHGQSPASGARLAPALAGLRHVAKGGTFDAEGHAPGGGRRFLGWTTELHWAFD